MMAAGILVIGLAAWTPAALAADAAHPLRGEAEILSGLLSVAIAKEIADRCPEISGRMVKGYWHLLSLQRKAKDLGYTSEQIDAYMGDREEKDHVKGLAEAWFTERGVDLASGAGFCEVGRLAIDEGSEAGSFLRRK